MIGSDSVVRQVIENLETSNRLTIRSGTAADCATLRSMIVELAESTNQGSQVSTTPQDFNRDAQDQNVKFRTFLAEWDGAIAGFTMFFDYYSSWSGPGIYLEDLYVRPSFQRNGIAKALIARVCSVAVAEKRNFLRWAALDWNLPAISLYQSLGALPLDSWRVFCLPQSAVQQLAGKSIDIGEL